MLRKRLIIRYAAFLIVLAATAPLIEALAPDGRLRLTALPAAGSVSEDNSTGDSDA